MLFDRREKAPGKEHEGYRGYPDIINIQASRTGLKILLQESCNSQRIGTGPLVSLAGNTIQPFITRLILPDTLCGARTVHTYGCARAIRSNY